MRDVAYAHDAFFVQFCLAHILTHKAKKESHRVVSVLSTSLW